MTVRILEGDCRVVLASIADASVNCCVTSPPYFGLRDYGVDGQMGLEASPDEFIAGMVEVFREVRRVLRDDGTLWLNIGDSYAGSWGAQGHGPSPSSAMSRHQMANHPQKSTRTGALRGDGIKAKDLIGIPWMLAFALRADGWHLRQDIIWSKPNPMPESVQDRCTKAHEYLFLLSKGPRYHFDQDAIAEPISAASVARLSQNVEAQAGSERVPGKTNGTMKAVGRGGRNAFRGQGAERGGDSGPANRDGRDMRGVGTGPTRNKRSVWDVATQPFKEAHFATFPPALVEPCILAGCPAGGVVIDPFFGAGTTGLVADRLQRDCIGIELNPAYSEIARRRIGADGGMFAELSDRAA
ncbi:DNA-methyltransferase [Sphingomonas sp. Xoc002]|uniref:DNA-methyltransferase n=1 Tax=Sphingomonas sp. Xoc002 TaxID=2837624 RepID=UPI003D185C83